MVIRLPGSDTHQLAGSADWKSSVSLEASSCCDRLSSCDGKAS